MDTILDYIRWRGDIPLAHDGLREADAIVLSLLSYYDYQPMLEGREEDLYLRDCLQMVEQGTLRVLISGKDMGYGEIFARAAASRRFGDLRITDFTDLMREEPPLQFAALCFHDESGISFLAYRGTDSTLAGWEEDFRIAVSRTEAQELALRYADEHLKVGRRWYMGGHSKGGNLALFAAIFLQEDVLDCLERIFILDGPGLCPEVMDISGMARIDGICTRIIPRFSVVGKLFEPKVTDSRIVQSTVSGMMSHSLATWGIDHGDLALCEENDPRSLWINASVDEWIDGMSQEDRVLLIHDLFDALGASGARTLAELDDAGPAGFETILRRLFSSSEATKKAISELPKQAVTQALNAASRLTGIRLRRSDENAHEEETENI